MTKIKLVSICAYSLLFLLTNIMPLGISFVVKAQRPSAPPTLEGIQYEGPIIFLAPGITGIPTLQAHYIFEKQGRVTCRIITITPSGTITQQRFNMVTQTLEPTMVFIPGGATSTDEIGTYKQNGSTVRLEFSNRYIEATVKADGLMGMVTYKESNKKEQWVVAKLGTGANSPSSSEIPKSTQPITEMDRERAAQSYMDGLHLLDQRKYSEAIGKFDEAIAIWPANVIPYFDRGSAKMMLRNYREAIKDFDKFIEILKDTKFKNSSLEDAYKWRGNAKLEIKDYRGALADYNLYFQSLEKPIEPKPVNSSPSSLGEGIDASQLTIYRQDEEVYKNRGIAKYKLGNKVGACEDFRKACESGNSFACEEIKIICN
jgi:TolA-binding protein